MHLLPALSVAAPQLTKQPAPASASLLGRVAPRQTWQRLLCRCVFVFQIQPDKFYVFSIAHQHCWAIFRRVTMAQMNPEMMSQAMDMFTKMDPDVLANMARSMGGAPGPGTQASAGLDMPQNAATMQQMLNNPQASHNAPCRAWSKSKQKGAINAMEKVAAINRFSLCLLVCRP